MPPATSRPPTDDHADLDDLLAGLNDAQRDAVTSPASPLAILAGAGSGKTRVLTRRIAYRVLTDEISADHVLAVTFTRKAGAELRSRLGVLGLPTAPSAGTFHSIAFAQLRQRWAERDITPPAVLDRKVGMVARLFRSKSSSAPLDVVSEIEWAKARMITADDYAPAAAAAGRTPPFDPERIAEIYTRYEQEKLSRRMVDFDDLLRLATRDLNADADYAAARRWKYRHLFVDEFQDVNPLQFELLRAWLGPSGDLCMVGDPNQAIYSWNGADASYLTDVDEHFPAAETVALTDNYRSSPQILGVANAVLATGPSHALRLRPNKGDGKVPEVVSYPTDQAEARGIAHDIRTAHAEGAPWSAHAVLVRTNAQLALIEETFRKASIPTRSRGAKRLLDLPEVRDALGSLRSGPGQLAERLDAIEADLSAPEAGEGRAALNSERAANVVELVRLGREYLDVDPSGSAAGFEGWLASTLGSGDTTSDADAVDLVTFHAAKGLEWPTVHLAGLEEGLVPIHHAKTLDAENEERRLFYVALTRSERRLHLSWAEQRTFGSKTMNRKPSPHLETVELATELLAEGSEPINLGSAVAEQRRRLAATPRPTRRRASKSKPADDLNPADRALLGELKAWRLAQSRLADVPAFVIFNDATLIELATRRPSSAGELTDISGIGAVKAQRFGPAVLELIADDG